ncbi:R3H-associated N-terminal domain-containing protein [Staphylotrichum tortipilum]|uniref:R3H-associated N-terminal domain-containing protein n=1 Tax=Staphylotrichum tortipilum TaxID=2831512 RepID=A0AAN6MRZ5_9PEZI|nr:R3H-associated N-terminal domain-containing protein [Staphylotrichum longicolle]
MAITRTPLAEHDAEVEGDTHPHEPLPAQHPSHPPHSLHHHSLSDASTMTVDIEAWTVAALESLSICPIARGTGNALSIPLDADHGPPRDSPSNGPATEMKLRGVSFGDDAYGANITPPRRPPSRRDSMRKRDMLLKGKEGSRQRRRWENDRLIHVPNVQPPLPSDWQIHPTHRVLPTVPYQLAQFWDKGLRERAEAQHRRKNNSHAAAASSSSGDPEAGHVPRDLRATAKRTPAVKSWLRVLEEPVRQFVVERGLAVAAPAAAAGDSSSDETDLDDEEIVFVGRNGRMRDGKPWKKAERQVAGQRQEVGMVLDAMEEGDGGAFKRWLTHSISDYYGLDSKSVMIGNPARRVVYVGVKQKQAGPRHKPPSRPVLPPPLWEMF